MRPTIRADGSPASIKFLMLIGSTDKADQAVGQAGCWVLGKNELEALAKHLPKYHRMY